MTRCTGRGSPCFTQGMGGINFQKIHCLGLSIVGLEGNLENPVP